MTSNFRKTKFQIAYIYPNFHLLIAYLPINLLKEPKRRTIMMYQRFYEKAIENFENCIKINDSNWSNFQILMKIGICYKELGKVELALKNLNEGLILSDACYCESEEKLEWQNIARLYINLISRDLN